MKANRQNSPVENKRKLCGLANILRKKNPGALAGATGAKSTEKTARFHTLSNMETAPIASREVYHG